MKHVYQGIDRSWTSISRVSRQFPVGKYKNVKVQRTQFPLQLAAGKTVHRSQGDTLDKIVVQLPDKKSPHMHYVALSRVTTLSGLKNLNPFNPDKFTVSEDVKTEMARLRDTSEVSLCFTPIYTSHHVFSICFLNAQSLPLHLLDIKQDRNLMAADTLMLVETKLCSKDKSDTLSIPHFDIHLYDYSDKRSPYGTIIYTKTDKVCVGNENKAVSQLEIVYIHITQPLCINVFSVYAKPNTKLNTIIKDISSVLEGITGLVIVMGDFNCEGQRKLQLETHMKTYGLQQKILMPTTNNNTTLDLVFTNIQVTNVGILETYFSYHKTVFLTVPTHGTLS
ncbi:uncharacterized protein LOC132751117 [Ruditapes philippinarum]|uniref:uncharacterized protein LOC132751117 n=1 Tax=Ruditapes philippinarum TaxID=129788 RepID=UPI00295BE8F7|nr:uncharacterized protein LOC132751117 [Ruditapes philippinarum]